MPLNRAKVCTENVIEPISWGPLALGTEKLTLWFSQMSSIVWSTIITTIKIITRATREKMASRAFSDHSAASKEQRLCAFSKFAIFFGCLVSVLLSGFKVCGTHPNPPKSLEVGSKDYENELEVNLGSNR